MNHSSLGALRRFLVLLCAAGLLPAQLTAQDSGFYLGLEAGFSQSNSLDTAISGINHPTRCDRLLYADPSSAPNDSTCTHNTWQQMWGNSFDLEAGFAGGVQMGYRFGRLRVEGEYLHQSQGRDTRRIQLGSAGNAALGTKDSEWDASLPPSEGVSDFTNRQVLLNLYYDFGNGSSWNPYMGLGVGLGKIEGQYKNRLLRRNDLAQFGAEEWRAAAAGTLSSMDTSFGDTVFGFQLALGVDYAIGDTSLIGAKLRWTRFEEFTEEDQLWDTVRSHAPVTSDGVMPFLSDLDSDAFESWTLTIALKKFL